MDKIAHIKEEGKYNPNTYLIDDEYFRLKHTLALYVIESGDERILIDTGVTLNARKVIKKLKKFNIYPIQKVIFTHAHWDHIQAFPRLKSKMKDVEVELIAHENSVEILNDPDKMNEFMKYSVEPMDVDNKLKGGDLINLNGLELQIIELFGHTQDSIAIYDKENKNIIVGDAIIDMTDRDTYLPVFFGPEFKEQDLLKSYKKLKDMKNEIDSISLSHFGVYTDEDAQYIIENIDDMYFKAKNGLIKWYNQGLSLDQITEKYQENIVPNSKLFTKENLQGLRHQVERNLSCLKEIGFI